MKKIEELTLQEKLGQLLIVGFHGYEFNEQLHELISKYKVGNFILFARNIHDKEQLMRLTTKLHEVCLEELGVIPFICIDQEGGMVTRIMEKETTYPGQMTLAATQPQNARYVGELMGKHLMSFGINYNFAPDVDVNNNPDNPVIGVRSYGDSPQLVSKYAIESIKGMQSNGLIACAKHFPGHGDVSVDSHLGLPTITYSKQRLNRIELPPFKAVIQNKVQSIMVAHIIFNEYDKSNPATVSETILTNILRKKMHFKGLIVSDDMEMKAIDDIYTAPVGAVKGIVNGLDLACVCHTYDNQVNACKKLMDSYDDGILTMEEIDKKITRILKAKNQSYKTLKKVFYAKKKPNVFLDSSCVRKCQNIVDASLTKVGGHNFKHIGQGLVIYSEAKASTIAEDQLNVGDLGKLIATKTEGYDSVLINPKEYNKTVVNMCKNYETVVFISFNAYSNPEQAKMINDINATHSNFTVLSLRNPYDYLVTEEKCSFYTLYEATPLAYNSVIKFLDGKLVPMGMCPVNLARHFNVGASVYIEYPEYSTKANNLYLKNLKTWGVDTVFASANNVLKDPKYLDNLKKLVKSAKNLGIKLVVDVNKYMMDEANLNLDVHALRLDYGYRPSDVAKLINSGINVELNASTIDEDYIKELIALSVNTKGMRISHNFYPKPYTGLSHNAVLEKNLMLKKYGFEILAFIPSSHQKRGPVHEGLCTIEEHRYADINSILADLNALGVDDVCFGDAYASVDEIDTAKNYNKDVLSIPCEVYTNINAAERNFLSKEQNIRFDSSDFIYRTDSRARENIRPFNTVERHSKDITIDNKLFDCYNGELNICRTDLPLDEKVNVLGKVLVSDWLLNNIELGSHVKFFIAREVKLPKKKVEDEEAY